ncbi:MAG: L-type lectin-domain containing protein [Bacteroidota bacterium]
MKKCFSLLLIFLAFTALAKSQSSVEEFKLGGNARILNDECIRLTPDVQYASGSAWYEKAIDLNQPFELTVCLVLGKRDELGADGIGFVFHPVMRTGYRGEGMGFAGLYPSLGIEFDTYQNYHLADPEGDHIAISVNGQPHHYASVVGPVEVNNLEDGNKHLLWIQWDPLEKELVIQLDGVERARMAEDIVANIFQGNPTVYWGVTAATGRKMNFHDICIKKLVFAEAKVD